MRIYLFSIAFIPVLYLCGTLTLSPFLKQLSRKQLGIIYGCYLLLLAVNVFLFYHAVKTGNASFALIKHALLLYGGVITFVHTRVLPNHTREWIFSAGLATLFHYLIGAVSTYLTYTYFGWNTTRAYLVMELLSSVLVILTYFPIRHVIVNTIRPFLAYPNTDYWSSIFLIPVAMLFACYFMVPGNDHVASFGQLISRLLMVCLGFLVCHSVSTDFVNFQKKGSIETQLRQQQIYYTSMQASLEQARQQRHDFKHHLVTITHYIETDNKDGLREYCGELLLQDQLKNPIPYSGNGAADGVIFHYIKACEQRDISFCFQGTIRSRGIPDTDLCVLLGNALDNALTACMTIPQDRFIHVTTQSEAQLLSILVQNSFDGVMEQQDDRILSRKRDHREGVGLHSMETICQKYGGMMERSWEDQVFTLCIHLPLPEKET